MFMFGAPYIVNQRDLTLTLLLLFFYPYEVCVAPPNLLLLLSLEIFILPDRRVKRTGMHSERPYHVTYSGPSTWDFPGIPFLNLIVQLSFLWICTPPRPRLFNLLPVSHLLLRLLCHRYLLGKASLLGMFEI